MDETYIDFARVLTEQFKAQMSSEYVEGDYSELQELMILENFMDKLNTVLQLF